MYHGIFDTDNYVNTLAYNGAQTTMVASGDRVSHVNGWSFHSDLPELTRDANVDSAQLLPAAVRAGHDLSSHGSRRSTNPFAAVIWQASCSTLALLSPTVRVIFSSSSSVCYTCEHGSRAIRSWAGGSDHARRHIQAVACFTPMIIASSQDKEIVSAPVRWQVFTFADVSEEDPAGVLTYGTDCERAFACHAVPFGFLQPRHGRGCKNRNGTVWRAQARSQSVP